MAYQIKVLVTKPDNLSSIPGVHMMEGENQFTHVSSNLTHVLWPTVYSLIQK